MKDRQANAWKSRSLVQKYLTGVRGAIPLASEQIDVMMRLISARGEPVTSFLDLGCGDGILAAAILEQYSGATGVLLDFSQAMLDAAQARLSHYAHNLEFALVDYGHRNWVDSVTDVAPFDAVVSGFSIHHQTDGRKQELYREIYGLLKPGGIFLNLEHVASATGWIESIFNDYFVDSLHATHIRGGSQKSREQIAQEYYNRPDKAGNILALVELQCGWLRSIGFEDVDCYFKVFALAIFGGRRPKSKN